MGLDLYMREGERAESDGVEPHYHLTWGRWGDLEHLLTKYDVLDQDDDGPRIPPGAEDLPEEDYLRIYDLAQQRWEAEAESRLNAGDDLRIPAEKFASNNAWMVSEHECRLLAEGLRRATLEDCREVFEQDEFGIESLRTWQTEPGQMGEMMRKLMGPPPTDEEYVADMLTHAGELADYLEAATRYLGVRVK
jgi:hypothetical protein